MDIDSADPGSELRTELDSRPAVAALENQRTPSSRLHIVLLRYLLADQA